MASDKCLTTGSDGSERDSELSFDDGNIVIVAEEVAFRVHKSLLSRNSIVFRDLFLAQQTLLADPIDHCPSMRVSDTSFDLRELLRLVYDSME